MHFLGHHCPCLLRDQGRQGRLGRFVGGVLHAEAGQQPVSDHQVRLRGFQYHWRLQTGT